MGGIASQVEADRARNRVERAGRVGAAAAALDEGPGAFGLPPVFPVKYPPNQLRSFLRQCNKVRNTNYIHTANVDGPVGPDDHFWPTAVYRGEEQPNIVRNLKIV